MLWKKNQILIFGLILSTRMQALKFGQQTGRLRERVTWKTWPERVRKLLEKLLTLEKLLLSIQGTQDDNVTNIMRLVPAWIWFQTKWEQCRGPELCH